MDAEFLDMMPDQVLITNPLLDSNGHTIKDKFGAVQHAASPDTVVRARVVYRTRQMFDLNQQIALSRAQVFLYGNHSIGPDHKIELPDGKIHLLVSVLRYPDEDGMYYETLFVE